MIQKIKNLFKRSVAEVIETKPEMVGYNPNQSKSLFISAGHSESDAGASREYDGRLWTEACIVLEFRDMVAKYLSEASIVFEMDGGVGENLPLTEAIKRAKDHDVAVEFHCNAFNTGHASGVETLSSESNMVLGGKLCEAVAASMGARNRGAKGEASGQHSRLGFISKGGGIILELFFITSPRDFNAYQDNKEAVAKAVADVLIKEVRDE